MPLKVFKINYSEERETSRIDRFIMDSSTNGEFINTVKYLSYHPPGRFSEDSIYVEDVDSGMIKCVLMSASAKDDADVIVSHPGTTFAGLIFNSKDSVGEMAKVVDLVEAHYKSNYKKIVLRTSHPCYSDQPNQKIDYMLLRKGYKFGFTALVNIIDLSKINTEDEIFGLYNCRKRNQVRKSINGNRFSFTQKENIPREIWMNMALNLDRKFDARPTHAYSEINELQHMFNEKIVPYATYKANGDYGAFSLAYKFKNVFHTQYLDMNYDLSRENPNYFLLHHLIIEAIREGYRYFSLGGSTEKRGEYLNEGLFRFKSGFGGGSILLPQYEKEL